MGNSRQRFLEVLAASHAAGCEVRRAGSRAFVTIPCWEEAYLPGEGLSSLAHELRLRVEVNHSADGRLSFRWEYWTKAQAFIHVSVAALVITAFPAGPFTLASAAFLGLTQVIPWAVHLLERELWKLRMISPNRPSVS